ncbi:MAG: TonB-dependent receptor [Ignavibacteriaceae bacterium]|jgi:hypothetical protein
MKRIFTFLLIFLILPVVALAQSGQLRGTITDLETGEPLLGANVLVVGTTQGAATDINGEYVILNLFADTYEVRATYIGYQAQTFQNVRVVAGLTSELNFQLAAEGIQVGEVEVVAERPLINKYNTNAQRITTSEDIDALPIRAVDNIYALNPGVVVQDNTVFIRGGRQDEVGYYLEGTNITDPVVGGRQVNLIPDALEEIQVQSGGYTAEFGGANSGIIKQQIKTGTSNLKASAEFITDNLGFQSKDDAFSGKKTLGTYWYGYTESIFSLSAPVGSPNIKFFGLFNYSFIRDQNPQAYPGINLGRIGDATTGDTLDFYYPAGATFNNSSEAYTGTGSLTFNYNPFIVRLAGTYTSGNRDNPWPATRNLTQLNSTLAGNSRYEQVETQDGAFNLKLTYLVNPQTFLEVNGGYSFNNLDRFDPVLKENWQAYGDSAANADAGYVWSRDRGNTGPYQRPGNYNILSFIFFDKNDVLAGFQKYERQTINGNISISSQISKEHNIKAGFEINTYDIANFSMNNETTVNLAGLLNDPNKTIDDETTIRRQGVNNYGYDVYGNKADNAERPWEDARKPIFMGAYIQDRMEYKDLVINFGLRYDYIDIDNWVPADPSRPETVWDKNTGDIVTVDGVLGGGLVQTPSYSSVSPRLGFSFALTEQTIFHAQWGKFVQQSRLRDTYNGLNSTGRNLRGGFFIPAPVGFNVRPTRTTQYDVGFTQQLGDFASFDITGYYKDVTDQVVYKEQLVGDGSPFGNYSYYTNGDVATISGVEVTFNMRRVQRFKVDANVSFASSSGTGSFPSSNRGIVGAPIDGVTQFAPLYIAPLEYAQAITAAMNLDFRFGQGDGGPVFQELGLTALLTYGSGHPYTRGKGGFDLEGNARDRQPLEPLNNSTTPSIFQVDMRLDKTFNIADVLNLNIYIQAINIFDTQNINNVFLRTGTPDDDGYLSDPAQGEINAASLGPDYVALYEALYLDYYQQWRAALSPSATVTTDGFLYGPPRQFRLGIRLEY